MSDHVESVKVADDAARSGSVEQLLESSVILQRQVIDARELCERVRPVIVTRAADPDGAPCSDWLLDAYRAGLLPDGNTGRYARYRPAMTAELKKQIASTAKMYTPPPERDWWLLWAAMTAGLALAVLSVMVFGPNAAAYILVICAIVCILGSCLKDHPACKPEPLQRPQRGK